jgi:hypothetical protein
MIAVRTRGDLSQRTIKPARPLQQGCGVFPYFLQLLSWEQRFLTRRALHVSDNVAFGEVKEIFTFRTATPLRLLIDGRINIHQNQAIVQPFSNCPGFERLFAGGTMSALIFAAAPRRCTCFIFHWRQTQSHASSPSCPSDGVPGNV